MNMNINFNTDLTWRDIAWRLALVAATVAIIVWFMPRDNRLNFKVEIGKVWRYNDLTSTFGFPVYKSDSTFHMSNGILNITHSGNTSKGIAADSDLRNSCSWLTYSR